MRCPCGASDRDACCRPYLAGEAWPPTAEALMRSRFTAFASGDAEHLLRTWHPRTRPEGLEVDDRAWTKLEILDVVDGGVHDAEGVIEFAAYWRAGKRSGVLRERSRFERRAGRWFYLDGE